MAVLDPRPTIDPPERLYRIADLAAMPNELPSGPVRYELDNGRLIRMAPPGNEHGTVEAVFVTALTQDGQRQGLGRVSCGEVAIILRRDPDRVVGADAAFIASGSLPIRLSKEGYLETIPDLIVEVVSKNDTKPYVQRKVADYLAAGVKVVWVADPRTKTVVAHRPGQAPEVFSGDSVLTVEDVIPGLRLPLNDVFQE
jgi:Uma2 family endonuclease